MFTGIIEAVGEISALEPSNGDLRLRVKTADLDLADVQLGDSIATNGACLTVVALPGDGFWADASRETLAMTTIAAWQTGQAVNLEKALTPQTRLGGHMVSGHVDGIGEVLWRKSEARFEILRVRAPGELAKYIARKGSITVDGTSLTVNAVDGAEFELTIIPHTSAHTVIGGYRAGTRVNLEVDLVARYLERLLLGDAAAKGEGLTREFLARHGFDNI